MRDTKNELLVKGHELAVVHGLGHLTSAVMQKATGFYRYALIQHFENIGNFRAAVQAYGIQQGTMTADTAVRCPRMAPAQRKDEILTEAFRQATENGLQTVTRPSVAKALGLTDGLINRYFGSVTGLREAVLAKAVTDKVLDVIADAIELQMSVQHIPPDLIEQARKILAAA